MWRYMRAGVLRSAALCVLVGAAAASWLLWRAEAEPAQARGPESAQLPIADEARERLRADIDALYAAAAGSGRQLVYVRLQQVERRLGELLPAAADAGSRQALTELQAGADKVRLALRNGRDPAGWREAAASLKLASDAGAPSGRQAWLAYGKLLAEDAAAVERAWQGPDPAAALQALAAMEARIARMEAAALLEAGPQPVSRLKESIRYTRKVLEASSGTGGGPLAEEAIGRLGGDALELFRDDTSAAAGRLPLAPPAPGAPAWQWTAILGAIIASVLGYASWRQYRWHRDRPVPPRRAP